MSTIEELKQKIISSGKITEEELQTRTQEKLQSLGGLISEEGAVHIIANELSVPLQSAAAAPSTTVNDLLPGMRNVNVIVKVAKKYEVRTFGQDGQGKVGSIYVGDESGFCRVTFWNDKTDYLKGINEQDVLEIQQAYTKENNGRTEIHMGNAAHCIVNPQGKTVTLKERAQEASERPPAPEKKLNDIDENDMFVNVTATVVQVYDPRFFAKDAATGQKLTEEQAASATNVEYNYVMNIFLDDGTTNLRAAVWKEQAQELLKRTDEEILALRNDQETLEQIKVDLLGTIIKARARVKKNEAYNNIELTLYDINTDPKPEVKEPIALAPAAETPDGAPKEVPTETPVEKTTSNDATVDIPSPSAASTKTTTTDATTTTKTEESESTPKYTESVAEEESLDLDDEELLSIDDIDEI